MLPQRNPNAWSCLPAAFATALEITLDNLLSRVGHDGGEIVHNWLSDPFCRKGFHPQEIIKVCLEDSLYVTRVELSPTSVSMEGDITTRKEFDIGGWRWFKKNMFNSCGVIDCRTVGGTGHAMAYQGSLDGKYASIYDPASGYTYCWKEPSDTEKRNRFLVALWRIDELFAPPS